MEIQYVALIFKTFLHLTDQYLNSFEVLLSTNYCVAPGLAGQIINICNIHVLLNKNIKQLGDRNHLD